MTEVDLVRKSHLVDPTMTVWGWEVPAYLFLGGLAAGVMVFSVLLYTDKKEHSPWVRYAPFSIPVLLSVGMFALFLDLEYKLHVFRFYTAFMPTSPMSWGAWILLGIYPVSLSLGIARIAESDLDKFPVWVCRLHQFLWTLQDGLGRAQIILGVGLGVYTGILLSGLGAARPVWNSPILGPLFLVSGLSTGAALMMLFPVSHAEHKQLRFWDVRLIVVELGLLLLLLMGFAVGGGLSGQAAWSALIGGAYTVPFLGAVVIAGLLVPLLLEWLEGARGLEPTRVAPVLLLVGGAVLRWVIVAAGQA